MISPPIVKYALSFDLIYDYTAVQHAPYAIVKCV